MWVVTLLLGGALIWLIRYWINGYFERWKKQGIPYLRTSSPFTTIFKFIFTDKRLLEIMCDDYTKLEGKKFAGHFLVLTPSIMIRDPELLLIMCKKDFTHFEDRMIPSKIHDLFSDMLPLLSGDNWRSLRHKMTPSFSSGKLKTMFEPIRENCDEVLLFLNRKIDNDIEARDFMFKYVVNVIGKFSFGLKVDALNEEIEQENEFLNMSKSFFRPTLEMIVKGVITMTMPKLRELFNISMVDKKIENFFRKLVRDMIAYRETSKEPRNDFLQIMLDLRKKEETNSLFDSRFKELQNTIHATKHIEENTLNNQIEHNLPNEEYNKNANITEDCIVAQTLMFILVGTESSAAVLSLVLYELAANPSLQRKVQDEIDQELLKNGFNYDTINLKMTYMEYFINETMRLHSIDGFLTRVCTKRYKIPGTDVVLEKGTVLSLPINNIMNDPQYYPEPEKFNPDRFQDENAIHPSAFFTFGVGPRMCIAKRLAVLYMKMIITAMLQEFTVTLSKKTKLPLKLKKASMMQHIEGGIWVQFKRRTKKETL